MRIPFIRELSARLSTAELRYWEAFYYIDSGAFKKKREKAAVGEKLKAALGTPKKSVK